MPDDQQKNTGAKLGFLRGNMLVMITTSSIWQFTGNAVWPFLSLYVLALGGPPEMIGVISGIGTLSSILPTVFGGYLADVYGRKKVTALFSVILGFTSLLIALASDWRMLAVAVVVDSIAAGFREPAMSALIADSLSYESRGVGFAAWAIVPAIPSVVSPVIAGYLIDVQGTLLTVKWGYALTGLTALVAGICRHLFLKETVRVRRSEARSVSSMARAVTTTHKELSRELWILLIAENLFWLGWAAASPYFILYGTTDVIGLTAGEWGLILLISNMAKVLGFVFGSAADRYGRRNVTAFTSLLVGVSSFLFLQLRTLPQVALVFAINSLSTLVAQQMSQALRADACPRESRSRVYSFFIIWQYFTRTIGSVMGGFLYISVTKAMPFYFQTLVSIMSAAILASLVAERVRRRN
jgi:MFS family permease